MLNDKVYLKKTKPHEPANVPKSIQSFRSCTTLHWGVESAFSGPSVKNNTCQNFGSKFFKLKKSKGKPSEMNSGPYSNEDS